MKLDENLLEKIQQKTLSFQEVTDYRCQQWYKGSILEIFNTIKIDDSTEYLFKDYPLTWYSDTILRTMYENKNLNTYLDFDFKFDRIPKRCENYFDTLQDEFYDHLKSKGERSRVSKVKMRTTLRLLLKNISRLKFHKRYAIKYSKHKRNWVGVGKNYSLNYFMELIKLLSSKGYVKDFTGFGEEDEEYGNVLSMLLVTPNFIDMCNGYGINEIMDEDFRLLDPKSCEIRVKTGKKTYKVIPPAKEEKEVFQQAEFIIDQLNEKYKTTLVEIGNVAIPEYFLIRIFRDNTNKCGRLFDKSEIQGESETTRSTIRIDKEDTIELDYKSLHYAMAAEELGIELNGRDPYDFKFDIEVNQKELDAWKENFEVESYDPVRNIKKTALLVMFNAKSKESAVGGISHAIKTDYQRKDKSTRRFVGLKDIPVTDLVEAIISNNSEVSEYFNSGVGTRFQNLDSQMIMYCIERFIEKDEVLLPVHDSIIIKESLRDFGIQCMKEAYKKVMGSDMNCVIDG